MQSISSDINPNTRGLTSNYKNTAIKDKETYNEAMSQHLLNPVEDLVQVLKTPIKLAKSSSLSRQNNSVNIAEGQRIRVNGGHVLTATAHGVEVSGGDNPYDTQSYVKAQRMADALASMLRNAGGTNDYCSTFKGGICPVYRGNYGCYVLSGYRHFQRFYGQWYEI